MIDRYLNQEKLNISNTLLKLLKNQAEHSCEVATSNTHKSILELLEKQPNAKILDLGCGGAKWRSAISEKVGTREIFGIDIFTDALSTANKNGVNVILADLDRKLPLLDKSIDIVVSNQTIEHLKDVDNFLAEIKRILKPKGFVVISTENLSSLDNLFSLFLGEQAFSQQISSYYNVGNRFSPHFSYKKQSSSMPIHRTIFTYHGLKRFLMAYGFQIEKGLGIATFPMPSFLCRLSPVHSRYITFKARL